MANEKIRIGIVGAGGNTRLKHIPGLQAIDDVEVVSICNRSRESSEKVASEYGISTIYDSWIELVEASDTNAIVIGTWPYLHCPVTLEALANDKHVMCEARMAMNAGEAHVMKDAAAARPDLIAQVVPSPFTLGVDTTVRRLIREQFLGDILSVEVRFASGEFMNRKGPLQWRHDMEKSGFNIMTMGIWYEALLRWVGHVTAVTAMGKTYVKNRFDPEKGSMRPVRIPEHIVVLGDMECGAQLTMTVSSISGGNEIKQISLFGSLGTLLFDNGKLYGQRKGEEAIKEIAIPPEEKGGWRVEEEFISAIRGGEKITHTRFEDGVKYMEFTEAVTRSMAERRTVILPLTEHF